MSRAATPTGPSPHSANILADAGLLFDRGVPVRLTFDQIQGGAAAQIMSPDGLVLMAHNVCRPYALKQQKDGTIKEINVRLPRAFAVMYLDWRGEWRLPLLNGIASAPLLREDGTIFCAQGYDAPSGMWLENVPDLADAIPDHPTRGQAEAALHLLRETFKTFCFADAASDFDAATGLTVVDTNRPPGRDESAFLVGLLTAVCRPSLHLAPGVLLRAAPLSGAGAGKGLLARCISMIAFGHEPYAVTGGGNAEELEKRIASELIAGGSALFLDNMNNTALKSDLLASAITERPARVRVLGRSQMVPLNASAFVILTGNGLTVSEDLARRFIAVEFDPGTEDPESRPFTIDIRAVVKARRQELLSALLTIWRWGRLRACTRGQNPRQLRAVVPVGAGSLARPRLPGPCRADQRGQGARQPPPERQRSILGLVGVSPGQAGCDPGSRRAGKGGRGPARTRAAVSRGSFREARGHEGGRFHPDPSGSCRHLGRGNLFAP